MRRKLTFVVIGVFIGGAVAGGIAFAGSPVGGNGVIHGCYNPSTGAFNLRVDDTCSKTGDKTPITWNQQGLAGPGVQIFTSSGTYTVPSGVSQVEITAVGGGGGGGGYMGALAGGGGGQGASVTSLVSVIAGATLNIAVGEGGAGGTGSSTCGTGTNGQPGDSTYVTAGDNPVDVALGGSAGAGGVCGNDGGGGAGGTAFAVKVGPRVITTIKVSSGSAGASGSGPGNCQASNGDTGGYGGGVAGVDGSGGIGSDGGCISSPSSASGTAGFVEILPA